MGPGEFVVGLGVIGIEGEGGLEGLDGGGEVAGFVLGEGEVEVDAGLGGGEVGGAAEAGDGFGEAVEVHEGEAEVELGLGIIGADGGGFGGEFGGLFGVAGLEVEGGEEVEDGGVSGGDGEHVVVLLFGFGELSGEVKLAGFIDP